MIKSVKLLELKRAAFTERIHKGYVCVVDINGSILFKLGDFEKGLFLLRSAQKPFQALPVIKNGIIEKFNLELKHLAICCASHTGSDEHTKVVSEILKKAKIDQKMLKCGIHQPLDEESKYNLIKNNLLPTPLHNNCSGKHAGMLCVCKLNNWDLENYLDLNHPLQKQIANLIKELSEFKGDLTFALDGCNAPVAGLPLFNIGLGYLNLFSTPEGQLLLKACIENSFFLGGKNRLDTEIIDTTNGKLFAKVGAEGLCVIVNIDKKQALIVKIEDGNNFARAIVCIETLKKLGWININEYDVFNSLYSKKVTTSTQKTAGEAVILF
jgi:L-asparaginase II